MKFIVNSTGLEIDFSELKDPVAFLDSIKKREISMEEAQYKQKEFDMYLKKIRIGYKSEEQNKTLANSNMLFNGRNEAVKLTNDCSSMIIEAKIKAAEEPEKEPTKSKRLKKLTPKQMLQRLPIALAQVKAGNTSENLLNKIRKIICSVHRTKEIPKKVHNHIMNSIKI